MTRTLRRFRTGEYRFISGNSRLARAGAARLLKELTQPARDEEHTVWASCQTKPKDDIERPQFMTRALGVSGEIKIEAVTTTTSSKLRGTREVKQIRVSYQSKGLGAIIFTDKAAFSKRLPSCIDKQLKLKG